MNAESRILGRELVELRDAVAGNVPLRSERGLGVTAPPSRASGTWPRVASPSQDPWVGILFASRAMGTIQLDEAEGELARVHAAEGARLLREAAILRCSTSATGHAFLGPLLQPRAQRKSHRGALAAWRRRARAELALWRVDGFEVPALLRACLRRPIARWDEALALAQEALALDPCDAGRLCLACAEIVAGSCDRAALALEALLDRDPDSDLRRAAVCALAMADRCAEESRSAARDDLTQR